MSLCRHGTFQLILRVFLENQNAAVESMAFEAAATPPLLMRAPSDGMAQDIPALTRSRATQLLNRHDRGEVARRHQLARAGLALLSQAGLLGATDDVVYEKLSSNFADAAAAEEFAGKACVLLVYDPRLGRASPPRPRFSRHTGRPLHRLELDYNPDKSHVQSNKAQLREFPNILLTAQWSEGAFSGIWGAREKDRTGVYTESLCECARRELTEETGIPPARALELIPDGTHPTRYCEGNGAVFVVTVDSYDALWELATNVNTHDDFDPLETKGIAVFPICFEIERGEVKHWPHHMANGTMYSHGTQGVSGKMKSLLCAGVLSEDEVTELFAMAAEDQERLQSKLPGLAALKEKVLANLDAAVAASGWSSGDGGALADVLETTRDLLDEEIKRQWGRERGSRIPEMGFMKKKALSQTDLVPKARASSRSRKQHSSSSRRRPQLKLTKRTNPSPVGGF